MRGAFGFSGLGVPADVWIRFALSNYPDVEPAYNIRPTQPALTVTRNSPNLGTFRKSGIPAPWNEKQLLINAKSETVQTLPACGTRGSARHLSRRLAQ